MTQWIRTHSIQLALAVLTSLLISTIVGTWTATVEFQRLKERIDQREQHYDQRFRNAEQERKRNRLRIRWLEQNMRPERHMNGTE